MFKKYLLAGFCTLVLGIYGAMYVGGNSELYAADTEVTLESSTSSSGFAVKNSSGTGIFRVGGDGNIGIGTNNPQYKLDVRPSTINGITYALNIGDEEDINSDGFLDSDGGRIFTSYGDAGVASSVVLTLQEYDDPFILRGRQTINKDGKDAIVSFYNGNVGIGTSEPQYKLDVYESVIRVNAPSGERDSWVYHSVGGTLKSALGYRYSTDALSLYHNGADRLIINNSGNVGIGTTSPGSYKLYVSGSAYATGSWSSSDNRWKKDITPLNNSLSNVLKLQGVNYYWKTNEYPDKGFTEERQIGLIAQDVEEVIPELVHTDDEGYKSVSYEKLTAVLVEAVKELKKENDALRQEIRQISAVVKTFVGATSATFPVSTNTFQGDSSTHNRMK